VKDLRSKYGDYAIVTGASAGIGEQFTRQLAAKGMNVVMVARRKDRLDALANEIVHQHGTLAEVVELDLIVEGAVDELVRRTAHLDIGMVIANAGNYAAGPFLSNDLGGEVDVLTLNATVPMELTHRFGRRFAGRACHSEYSASGRNHQFSLLIHLHGLKRFLVSCKGHQHRFCWPRHAHGKFGAGRRGPGEQLEQRQRSRTWFPSGAAGQHRCVYNGDCYLECRRRMGLVDPRPGG